MDPEITLATQLIQQGGFLAVLVAVLFFYRRDYARALRLREQQLADRTALVQQVLTLLSTTARAIEQNSQLAERVARAVEHMNGRRRASDPVE